MFGGLVIPSGNAQNQARIPLNLRFHDGLWSAAAGKGPLSYPRSARITLPSMHYNTLRKIVENHRCVLQMNQVRQMVNSRARQFQLAPDKIMY